MKRIQTTLLTSIFTALWCIGTNFSFCSAADPATSAVSNLSLRETIRQVAEVTNVLPLDVYSGTTLKEYRDWDCRYDLTYKEFRPNYVLALTARNSSVKEVLECVDDLEAMPPKEKALTCAALVAFVGAQRERETTDALQVSAKEDAKSGLDFNEEQKGIVLQKLERLLNDQEVAFPKIEETDQNLSLIWEENVRKECYSFMKLPARAYERKCLDGGYAYPAYELTARSACFDLYEFPTSREKEPDPDRSYLFAEWNNESKQLPIKFLCSIVLAQAAYDASQRSLAKSFLNTSKEELLKNGTGSLDRVLTAERFQLDRSAIVEERFFHPDRNRHERQAIGEGLIMNAFLRTQYVASRLGIRDSAGPICGNSFRNDVTISEVVQKTIDALSTSKEIDAENVEQKANQSAISENGNRSQTSLLETIRENANGAEFFSTGLFIEFYANMDFRSRNHIKLHDYVLLPVTYERFRPFGTIYESAKRATRTEIVDCLKSFDWLSAVGKAFVLESVTLYLWRSENPKTLENQSGTQITERLSDDEKRLFSQLLLKSTKDRSLVVLCLSVDQIYASSLGNSKLLGTASISNPSTPKEMVIATRERTISLRKEWESSFRKSALEFQKILGKRNPYYVYDSNSEEMWRCVCDEAPAVLLYSMLSMEEFLDLEKLELVPLDSSSLGEETDKESVQREIDLMRYYLFLQSDMKQRNPFFSASLSSVGPKLGELSTTDEVELSRVAQAISSLFPNIEKGELPQFPKNNH